MKTSKLIGPALDWAVAKCEGLLCFGYHTYQGHLVIHLSDGATEHFHPATDWALAGPIIERERIELNTDGEKWLATRTEAPAVSEEYGPTPLIAAMRCYVASKLGDDVDVPEEVK